MSKNTRKVVMLKEEEEHAPEHPSQSYWFLNKGSKVEVWENREGLQNTWFPGTIKKRPTRLKNPLPANRSKKKKKATVVYDHMISETTGKPLVERVKVTRIRPAPPLDDGRTPLEPYDVVDAFYDDVWWTGYVISVANDRITVAFKDPPDVVELGRSEVRLHWQWVRKNIWVRPPKEAKADSKSLFNPAMEVELDLDELKPETTWLPAIYLGYLNSGFHLVKCATYGQQGFQKLKVLYNQIRPRPPEIDKDFKVSEKVNALRGSIWTVGSVTKVLVGDMFAVKFEHLNCEVEFHRSLLRPHLDWADGRWTCDSKGLVLKSGHQATETADDETPEQVMEDVALEPMDLLVTCEAIVEEEANKETSETVTQEANKVTLEAIMEEANRETSAVFMEEENRVTYEANVEDGLALDGAEDTVTSDAIMEEANRETSAVFMEEENRVTYEANVEDGLDLDGAEDTVTSDAIIEGTVKNDKSRMSCELNPVINLPEIPIRNLRPLMLTDVGHGTSGAIIAIEDRDTENLEASVAESSNLTESQAQVSKILAHASNDGQSSQTNDDESDDLPFEKNSQIWQCLYSMEVYAKHPQKPHFRPLLEKDVDERQGLAIAHMVNFANMISKVWDLNQKGSREFAEQALEKLRDYEEMGFDVEAPRDLLVFWLKTREMEECVDERTGIERELVEIGLELEELARKRAALMTEVTERALELTKLASVKLGIGSKLSRSRDSSASLLTSIRQLHFGT